MFICFFALWVVLNGKWTTEIGVFGLVFAALAYAFTWKYMGYSPKVDVALFMRVPSAVRYGVNLVVEIIKANLSVLMIICRGNADPCIRTIKTGLKTKFGRVMLANAITLTPGTVSVQMLNDRIIVHCLTDKLANELGDMKLEKQLKKMEVLALGERV